MKIFIGCTSKNRTDSCFFDDCDKLIRKLASVKGIDVVYGVWDSGLSKVVYDEFSKYNKKIIGVVTAYHKNMLKSKFCDEEIIVSTTTQRFEKIYENSDVLLFLPGGIGTYAELLSAIEEQRINNKKIILFNNNFFFTPIIEELYRLYKLGLVECEPFSYITIESEIDNIINIIKEEMN